MKLVRKLFKPFLLVCLVLAASVTLAQVVEPTPVLGPSQAVQDWVKNTVDGGILLVVPLLVMAIRKYVTPKIPRIVLPILVFGLTTGLNILTSVVLPVGDWTWLGNIGMTAGAVFIREIITTLQDHGVS